MQSSIFDDIADSENNLTYLLKNYLRFKVFRDLFLGILDAKWIDKNKIKHEDFDAQVRLSNGIPDLILKYDDKEVFIEIKTNPFRELTPNQPNEYLNFLINESDAVYKALILLCPENYAHEEKFQDACNLYLERHDQKRNIHIHIIKWKQILDLIKEKELASISELFKHFEIILQQWFAESTVSFTNSNIRLMYTNEIPETLDKLFALVENIANSLQKKHQLKLKMSKVQRINEYGFYIHNNNQKEILWFGIWKEAWLKFQKPLSLCLQAYETKGNKSLFNNHAKKYNLGCEEFMSTPCITIDSDILNDPRCQEILIDIIVNFCSAFNLFNVKK